MDPAYNPYTPGAGVQPAELVGRESELEAFDRLIARAKLRYPERGMVLYGLRGVGKTVLLRRMENIALNQGWMTIFLEGQPGESGQEATRRRLGSAIAQAARSYAHRSKASKFLASIREVVTSFTVTMGPATVTADLDLTSQRAGSGQLDLDFEELVEDVCANLGDGAAFVVFVDELQDLDRDLMAALVTTQHLAGQRGMPFYVMGAGLPNLPAELTAARSYAERLFEYREIGPIALTAARDALTVPAARHGARYEEEAITTLTTEAQGYPYFIQEFGKAAWLLAQDRTITIDDAHGAIAAGYAELDRGFFPSRWNRATPTERRYLAAVASSGGQVASTAQLVAALGASSASELSSTRADLIRKGLIFAPEHGRVAFTVPGMTAFIRRQEAPPSL
ncbi:MAG: AAA family ATPase [Cumulibacter sp.]